MGVRPRWPGWMSEVAGAISRSRMSADRCSEGRARWLLPQQNGEEQSEAGRERKRESREDPSGGVPSAEL